MFIVCFFFFFFFSTCFDLSSSTKVVSSEQMGKYFLCSLELDEDVPVTADMLTDDAMAAFVAYMWTPEKSRSQIRKVQGWFKDRRTEFGLPDPNLGNHEAKFRWRGYIAALAGCRRDPKWSQKIKALTEFHNANGHCRVKVGGGGTQEYDSLGKVRKKEMRVYDFDALPVPMLVICSS